MSVPVVVAGMAWACGPSGYGTPDAPPVPPSSTAAPPTPPVAAPAPGGTAQAPASPVVIDVAPGESGSATAKAAPGGKSGSKAPQAPSPRAPAARTIAAPSPAAQADITARVNGSTAGVVQAGRQSVFASSTAPGGAAKATRGESKARAAVRSKAPAVSERSATADLWSGVGSAGRNPSLASAAALGGESGGLSGGVVAAVAVLGLGLAGIAGGALVTARRRRRATGSGGAPEH